MLSCPDPKNGFQGQEKQQNKAANSLQAGCSYDPQALPGPSQRAAILPPGMRVASSSPHGLGAGY